LQVSLLAHQSVLLDYLYPQVSSFFQSNFLKFLGYVAISPLLRDGIPCDKVKKIEKGQFCQIKTQMGEQKIKTAQHKGEGIQPL